jgi:hypothetical protein
MNTEITAAMPDAEISQEAARAMLAALRAAHTALHMHRTPTNRPTVEGCNIALGHITAAIALAERGA